MTGILTAFATCHTILRAIGLIAGPDSPPVIVDRAGLIFSTSTDIPSKVFIREIESAPSSSTTLAKSTTFVTLGDNLTISFLA
jgi:hypothetical protein